MVRKKKTAAGVPGYGELCSFENLYKAHRAARRGKRHKREVIEFEMNLAENICRLQSELQARSYKQRGYYHFMVYEPKARSIYAPYYIDRVVQHCLCDNILAPALERRLVHDNAACRAGKGTHFAIGRLSRFLTDHYRKHGAGGYFLKCDIRKYFDNIDHAVLLQKLARTFRDPDVLALFRSIIDSYEKTPGKGLPLGNQCSQWFALYYLDSLDRLVKERLRVRHYTRYMDDFILLHESKDVLRECLVAIRAHCGALGLGLNEKTQIFPIRNGVHYLGWRHCLTGTGKVVRKLLAPSKQRLRRRMRGLQAGYAGGRLEWADVKRSIASTDGHLRHGNAWRLRAGVVGQAGFSRSCKPGNS
jgi:retron-type reverse transcriptase